MKLKYIFWSEFLINIPSFFMCLFTPAIFIVQLTALEADGLVRALVQWYGVILFVLTFILGMALKTMNLEALRIIFMGYGIGDLMQIVVTWILAQHIGGWNFSLVFTVVLSVILCGSRIAALLDMDRMGFAD